MTGQPPPDTRSYWREHLRLIALLLAVWFTVSFGFGILLADWLDQFRFFGFRLGFWFAQQGSIYLFVGLIAFYAVRMNRLDRKHGVDRFETPATRPPDGGPAH
ncbi:MAG: DUF4212 domain-containing protein [Deltaproteobacteria bacterium]|nr:DUF4212 domain-containing protein [Deltaproteobacteria bacterium]